MTYTLKTCKSIKDLCVCAVEFFQRTTGLKTVLSYAKDNLWTNIKNVILQFVEQISPRTEAGFFKTIKKGIKCMKSGINTITCSGFYAALRDLVLRLVGLKFFDFGISSRFVSTLGLPVKGTFLDLLSSLFSALESFFDLGEAINRGDSIVEILNSVDSGVTLIQDGEEILSLENATYSGIKVEDKIDIRTLFQNASTCISSSEEKISLIPKTHPQFKILSNIISRLKVLKINLRRRIHKDCRTMPYSIILHGAPGVGKSSLVEHVCKIHSHVKGRVFEISHMYNRNVADDFMSGYEPESQPYFHYSEIGSIHSSIAAKQGDSVITEFLSVCDSLPMLANMPDLDSKGNVYVCPEMIVADVNDPEMNLSVVVNNPAAVRRRSIYAEIFVKEDFREDGSCKLDTHKVKAALESGDLKLAMDIFQIRPYRMIPIDRKKSEECDIFKQPVDIISFSQFLEKDIREHILKQEVASSIKAEGISQYLVSTESLRIPKFIEKINYKETFISTRFFWLLSFIISINVNILLFPIISFFFHILGVFYGEMVVSITDCFKIYFYQNILDIKLIFLVIRTLFTTRWSYFVRLARVITQIKTINNHRLNLIKFGKGKTSVFPILSSEFFQLKLACALIAASLTTYSIAKIINSNEEEVNENHVSELLGNTEGATMSSHVQDTDYKKYLAKVEALSECADPPPRKKNHNSVDWDKAIRPPVVVKGNRRIVSNEPREIMNTIARNVRVVEIVSPTDNIVTRVLGVCEDMAIINKHVFLEEDKIGKYYEINLRFHFDENLNITTHKVSDQDMVSITDDLLLVRFYGAKFTDIITSGKSLFPDKNLKPLLFGHDGYFLEDHEFVPTKIREGGTLKGNNKLSDTFSQVIWKETLKYSSSLSTGDCGKPLVFSNSKILVIAGIHCAGSMSVKGEKISHAVKVNTNMITKAIETLSQKSCFLRVFSEGGIRFPLEYGEIVKVHSRSPYRYEDAPGSNPVGSLSKYPISRKMKSRLIKSKFFKYAEKLTGVNPINNGLPIFDKPMMNPGIIDGKYVAPYNNFVKKSGVIKKDIPPHLLKKVISFLTDHLIKELEKTGLKKLTPVNLKVAQNGFSKDFYMRTMKNSTSGGFVWKGSKSAHNTPCPDELHPDAVMPNDNIVEQVLHQNECYENREDASPILGAQLKDEPRCYDKVISGKTRVFAMSTYDSTLVNRMYLLPFYSLMCEHRKIFRAALGINMHSVDVDDMVEELLAFSPFFFDGDYGGFDTSIPFLVGLSGNTIIYKILKHFGYSKYALQQVQGILSDNTNPLLCLLGVLVYLAGFQPSGKFATAEDNSLRNLIMLILGWILIMTPLGKDFECNQTTKYSCEDFFTYVLPWTYGDDLLVATKEQIIKYFNSVVFADFCKTVMGMKFTAADKTDNLKPTVSLYETAFLKRRFKYRKDLNHWVAALERQSIMKTIAYLIPSKNATEEEQSLDMLVSASREMFFHLSKENFEENKRDFVNVYSEIYNKNCDEVDIFFPSFQEIRASVYGKEQNFYSLGSLHLIGPTECIQCIPTVVGILILVISEEIYKRGDRIACWWSAGTPIIYSQMPLIFGTYELCEYTYRYYNGDFVNGNWTFPFFFFIRILVVLMHLVSGNLPFMYGVLVHLIWNLAAFHLEVGFKLESNPEDVLEYTNQTFWGSLISSPFVKLIPTNLKRATSAKIGRTVLPPVIEEVEPTISETVRVLNTRNSTQKYPTFLEGNKLFINGAILRKPKIVPVYLLNKTLDELRFRQDYNTNVTTSEIVKHLIALKCVEENVAKTTTLLDRRRKKVQARKASKRAERGVFTESGRKGEMEDTSSMDQVENVVDFVGETTQSGNSIVPISDVSTGTELTPDISRFFERYVTIYDSTWSTATDYNVSLAAWDLWTKDNSIRAKLSNYAYFKGTLEIKIVVSGTPFHYGKLMASYQAWPASNQVLTSYDDLLTSTVPTLANILPCYKTYMSQSPHVTYININENEPVFMEIPMIIPKNRAKLFNTATTLITSATSFEDFVEMGQLRLITLNHIMVANEDYTSSASIHVSARMKNVELGALTATNIDITAEGRRRRRKPRTEVALDIIDDAEELIEDEAEESDDAPPSWWEKKTAGKGVYQSGSFAKRISRAVDGAGDEYAEPGPVASIATAVSNVGESLKDIPYIGPFAKATSSVAKGVGKIASWFGFSKPLILEKPILIKNEPFSNGAFLAGNDTCKKLSCDPKQELTIDPSIGGTSNKDAMAIKSIISRESFIHTFSWADSDQAMTDVLWESMLTPFIIQKCVSASSTSIYQPIPMAWIAALFSYWRGSIIFRFEIVASRYHRGKLLFRYEPNGNQIALITIDGVQLNQQNNVIIDIQEVQDIEITVSFTSDRVFKSTKGSSLRQNPTFDSNNADVDPTDFSLDQHFGMIQVYPLNELQQPTDLGVAYINVFVKSEDMEFALPTNDYLSGHSYTYTETEAGRKSVILNQHTMKNDNIYDLYFGEKVESIRSLMRRYTTESIMLNNYGSTGGSYGLSVTRTGYPTCDTYPGTATTLADTNALPHIFNYMRFGYLGMRGGYRYRFYYTTNGTAKRTTVTSTKLEVPYDGVITQPAFTEVLLNTTSNASAFASPLSGAVKHMANISGTEVEVPFYTSDLFKFAWEVGGGSIAYGYNILSDWWTAFTFTMEQDTALNDKMNLLIDSAAAEDFTFFYFNGAPFYSAST